MNPRPQLRGNAETLWRVSMKACFPLRCSIASRQLILLLASAMALYGLVGPTALGQECAECGGMTASLEIPAPVPAGELVFRSQVNEVSVLFTVAQGGKFIADLTAQDVTIHDDNKPPAAIVGFRTQREL